MNFPGVNFKTGIIQLLLKPYLCSFYRLEANFTTITPIIFAKTIFWMRCCSYNSYALWFSRTHLVANSALFAAKSMNICRTNKRVLFYQRFNKLVWSAITFDAYSSFLRNFTLWYFHVSTFRDVSQKIIISITKNHKFVQKFWQFPNFWMAFPLKIRPTKNSLRSQHSFLNILEIVKLNLSQFRTWFWNNWRWFEYGAQFFKVSNLITHSIPKSWCWIIFY